jgi:hypothetical protein
MRVDYVELEGDMGDSDDADDADGCHYSPSLLQLGLLRQEAGGGVYREHPLKGIRTACTVLKSQVTFLPLPLSFMISS